MCIKVKLQRQKNWRPPTAPAEPPNTGVNGKENSLVEGTVIHMDKIPDDHPDGSMVRNGSLTQYKVDMERQYAKKNGDSENKKN